MRRCALYLAFAVPLATAACVHVFSRVETRPLSPGPADSVRVETPVKAHLNDGSVITFTDGATFAGGTIAGFGTRHDLRLTAEAPREHRLSLDSVVAVETYRERVNQVPSILVSTLATGAIVVGSVAIAKAIFGSCPTIYSMDDEAGEAVLEAEAFSFSISPLLEARDVDRLSARPRANGVLRLDVRNEALETHYINHMELLAVTHAPDEWVLPDGAMQPLAVGRLTTPTVARDRVGRDVREVLGQADGRAFASDPRAVDEAIAGDLEERLELAIPAPTADSVAVVLRTRSSLVTTVLLYDFMLGEPGAKSLDWIANGVEEISTAVELGRFFHQRMGLRLSVWNGNAWQRVGRLPDFGPIAWRDVAAVVPVPKGIDTLRVRLAFAPDGWRIDRAAFALDVRRPESRTIPPARLYAHEGHQHGAGLRALAEPDSLYVETRPAQRFAVEFDAGVTPRGETRTFLLASQGYYTEWVRGSWIKDATGEPFRPGDAVLVKTLERWKVVKDSMEARFHATRIPVR